MRSGNRRWSGASYAYSSSSIFSHEVIGYKTFAERRGEPMTMPASLSRRGFLAVTAASAASLRAQHTRHVPVGLLIYAVLADWKKDFNGTLTAVAKMGYEGVELTQYESWTPARAKEVRALLDSIKLKVFATHTEPEFFVPGDKMKTAIELNHILGARTVCCVR